MLIITIAVSIAVTGLLLLCILGLLGHRLYRNNKILEEMEKEIMPLEERIYGVSPARPNTSSWSGWDHAS